MSMAAASIRRGIAKLVRPRERISVTDAAERYVNVRTASGGTDRWKPELTPYMIEPMNCLNSRHYDAVIFVGPAQSGKTQGLITNFMAYVIKCDPADFLIMQTTKGTARDFDTQVIKRAFRDSSDLKQELAPGSKSDNTYDKVFKSGAILFQRWPSINEISGKPLKYVLITDYDRMTQNIDGEGSPFALAQQRTAKFLSRGMTLVETSPGFEITDPKHKNHYKHEAPPCGGALSLFNMGDMRRWYVQCPECGEYFMPPPDERGLSFDHDRDLFGATLTEITVPVRYLCTANGCLIDLHHKRNMNRSGLWVPEGCAIENGRIVGEGLKSRIASFWFPGILAAYSEPDSLVEKYLKAYREYDITRSEENLKTIINVNFGAPYLPKRLTSDVSAADYERRSEDLPKREVCKGVRFLIATVDVQKNRFEVQVHGHGVHNEIWLIDRFPITLSNREAGGEPLAIDPAGYIEDWLLLESKVIRKRYPLADGSGRTMGILITASDSGGEEGVAERAYTFWREMKKKQLDRRFILVKGERPKRTANKPKITLTHPDTSSKAARKAKVVGELPLWLVNTTLIKDLISANLNRIEPGQNYIHFPNWFSNAFYEELVAENRTEDGWDKPSGARNESFDLLCYDHAAYLVKLQNHWQKEIDWNHPPLWAADWDENSEVYHGDSETAAAVGPDTEKKADVRVRSARMRVRR